VQELEVHVVSVTNGRYYSTASVQYCKYSMTESVARTMISLNFSAAAKVKRRAAVRLRSCMTD
jgi:hypothetical protein